MKGQNLSLLEKQQLVEAYQSEVKKLQFQTALLKEAVSSLKDSIKEDKKAGVNIETTAASVVASMDVSTATPKKRGPGRPPKKASAKSAGAKKATRGRGRPPKAAKSAESTSATAPQKKRGPGRPPKKASSAAAKSTTASKSAAPKKRGRKPNQKVGGYRLSEWDALIVDGIKQAGRALIKPELLSLAEQKNKAEKLGMDDAAINVKISQCLHKLSNRRDDLVKVSYPGRGFAYALAAWKNSKGEVPKKYLP
jgi:hypothetical protein